MKRLPFSLPNTYCTKYSRKSLNFRNMRPEPNVILMTAIPEMYRENNLSIDLICDTRKDKIILSVLFHYSNVVEVDTSPRSICKMSTLADNNNDTDWCLSSWERTLAWEMNNMIDQDEKKVPINASTTRETTGILECRGK